MGGPRRSWRIHPIGVSKTRFWGFLALFSNRTIDRTDQVSTPSTIAGRTAWRSPIDRNSIRIFTYVSLLIQFQSALPTRSCLVDRNAGVPVVCLSSQVATVYRPRQPRQSPLYQLIERHLPEFERSYDDRYQQPFGPWRPIIGEVARKFLRCGDLHFGFVRVRCGDCGHELFVPFSCRQRCLCPSCHQKRSLLAADTIKTRRNVAGQAEGGLKFLSANSYQPLPAKAARYKAARSGPDYLRISVDAVE